MASSRGLLRASRRDEGRRVLQKRSGDAAIYIAGLGEVVTFHFDAPRMGRIVLYQTHAPEAPLRQYIRLRW